MKKRHFIVFLFGNFIMTIIVFLMFILAMNYEWKIFLRYFIMVSIFVAIDIINILIYVIYYRKLGETKLKK